jgi:hypothetical protein
MNAKLNGTGKRSQVERPSNPTNINSPPQHDPPALSERLDSLTVGNQHDALDRRQPRPSRSHESISSINSGDEDVALSTTALPPMAPPSPEKHPRAGSVKTYLTSIRRRDDADVIDPGFFEALRTGPQHAAASSVRQGSTGLHPNLQPSSSRTSAQYSRQSADHPPNPDFWRGLEEMLSDSDASVVFPPDIAKYKSRDRNSGPTPGPASASTATPAKIPRSRSKDNPELKRPTTAPAPRTTTTITAGGRSRDLINTNEPLPASEAGRQTTDRTATPSTGKPHLQQTPSSSSPPDKSNHHGLIGSRPLTTVQLVDTSSSSSSPFFNKQPKRTRRFLRKLRKKSYKGVDDGL